MHLEYISEKRKTFPPEFINREQTIHIINTSYYKKEQLSKRDWVLEFLINAKRLK